MDEETFRFLFASESRDMSLIRQKHIFAARIFVVECDAAGGVPDEWVLKVAYTNAGSVSE